MLTDLFFILSVTYVNSLIKNSHSYNCLSIHDVCHFRPNVYQMCPRQIAHIELPLGEIITEGIPLFYKPLHRPKKVIFLNNLKIWGCGSYFYKDVLISEKVLTLSLDYFRFTLVYSKLCSKYFNKTILPYNE